ncbi:hypothetical protein RSA46_05570 [Pseudomonas oryzihabitans]|nr:hypothetical protein SB5_10325 [Pseudomonas psychrotolerans]KTT45826.1 hypothetical protein RSA46_05570 [Pseudomonas psychrotolerans]
MLGKYMTARHPHHPQYMPIIKWQQFEQYALCGLDERFIGSTLPCIEVRKTTQHFDLMQGLAKNWRQAALIDYADPDGRLSSARMTEFSAFLQYAGTRGYPVTPVVDSRDMTELTHTLQQALKSFPAIALRLRVPAIGAAANVLDQAKKSLELARELNVSVRLIVDFGVTPQEWTNKDIKQLTEVLRELQQEGPQSLHLASGAFPISLAQVQVGEFVRRDWRLWKETQDSAPELVIGYSDYGVISPEWSEEALTKRGGRVAIRYTRLDDWLVLRADGNSKKHSEDLSVLMVNVYQDSFKGASYSTGDHMIAVRADKYLPARQKKSGTYHVTEGWIHHIAVVVTEQY